MRRQIGRNYFAVTAALLLFQKASALAVNIAIINAGEGDVSKVADAAQAQFATDNGMHFVERGLIKKILAEQKLSLSGAVSADQAIKAGALVSTDVLAVMESNESRTEATGVVVFDTHTGERLADAFLSGADDKTATALADALHAALGKVGHKIENRHPVCVLTVRNVDLSRTAEPFCGAIARLMERRLLASPDIVMLERERLNELRKERELTPTAAADSLVSSVTLLELQVARDPAAQGGVKATCVLTDVAGRKIGDAMSAASVKGRADELGDALAADIAKAIKASSPEVKDTPETRRAESERFYAEAKFGWSHQEFAGPLASMEAATALDSDNRLLHAELTRAMAMAATVRIETFFYRPETDSWHSGEGESLHLRATPEETSDSLVLMQSAMKRLLGEFGKASTPKADKINNLTLKLMVNYLEAIARVQMLGPPTPNHATAPALSTAEHFAAVRALRQDYFALQRLRNDEPTFADANDWQATMRASAGFEEMLNDPVFYSTATREEVLAEIDEGVRDLAEMWKRKKPAGSPGITGILELLAPARLSSDVCKMPGVSNTTIPLTADEKEKMRGIYEDLGRIDDPRFAAARENGLAWLKDQEPGVKAVVKSPQVVSIPYRSPRMLHRARGGTFIPTPAPADGEFWTERTLLIDEVNGQKTLSAPAFYEGHYYVVESEARRGEAGVHPKVIKLDFSARMIKETDREGKPYANAPYGGYQGAGTIADGYFILLNYGAGGPILLPIDGTAAIQLSAANGFDYKQVSALTVVAGKVYAAVSDNQALIVEYDIAKKTTRTLAASKRAEAQSPFDNKPPFHVAFMLADPARERILFCAGGPAEVAGLWQYKIKTGEFVQFAATKPAVGDRPAIVSAEYARAGPVIGDKVIVSAVTVGGILDLKTDQVTTLPSLKVWEGPNMTTQTSAVAVTEHYLWTDWGRLHLPGDPVQEFPVFRTDPSWVEKPRGFIPIDDNRILAYGYSSIWILAPRVQAVAPGPPAERKEKALPAEIVPPEGGELPWESVHTVYDHIRDTGKIDIYLSPRIVGENIYVLGVGHDLARNLRSRENFDARNTGFAQLLKIPLGGGAPTALSSQPLSQIPEDNSISSRFSSRDWSSLAEVAVDDHNYYAVIAQSKCVVVLPLDGSAGRKLNIDAEMNRLVVLDGRLYTGRRSSVFGDMPLIAGVDDATGKLSSLVDYTRDPHARNRVTSTPLHDLWSDAPRHRLLYLMQGATSDLAADGIWELVPATGKKRLIVPLLINGDDVPHTNAIFSTGTNADGTILIETRRGIIQFDPATDQVKEILRQDPRYSVLAKDPNEVAGPSENPMLGQHFIFEGRGATIQNNYLWFSFGRLSLDGKLFEAYPGLRSGPGYGGRPGDGTTVSFEVNHFVFFDGGKRVLVSDCYGAWILDLQK